MYSRYVNDGNEVRTVDSQGRWCLGYINDVRPGSLLVNFYGKSKTKAPVWLSMENVYVLPDTFLPSCNRWPNFEEANPDVHLPLKDKDGVRRWVDCDLLCNSRFFDYAQVSSEKKTRRRFVVHHRRGFEVHYGDVAEYKGIKASKFVKTSKISIKKHVVANVMHNAVVKDRLSSMDMLDVMKCLRRARDEENQVRVVFIGLEKENFVIITYEREIPDETRVIHWSAILEKCLTPEKDQLATEMGNAVAQDRKRKIEYLESLESSDEEFSHEEFLNNKALFEKRHTAALIGFNINGLPGQIRRRIFAKLDALSIVNGFQVCKLWREELKESADSKYVHIDMTGLGEGNVESAAFEMACLVYTCLKSSTKVLSVTLTRDPQVTKSIMSMVMATPVALDELIIYNGQMNIGYNFCIPDIELPFKLDFELHVETLTKPKLRKLVLRNCAVECLFTALIDNEDFGYDKLKLHGKDLSIVIKEAEFPMKEGEMKRFAFFDCVERCCPAMDAKEIEAVNNRFRELAALAPEDKMAKDFMHVIKSFEGRNTRIKQDATWEELDLASVDTTGLQKLTLYAVKSFFGIAL